MLTNYQSLCSFLCEADSASLAAFTFDELFCRFHADPVGADRAFFSVFGMSGEEIMEHYKRTVHNG